MNANLDALSAEIVFAEDADDEPVAPWSLDELGSDLESIRSAFGRTDD